MNTPTIAIIGAGNMGASLLGGLIAKGHAVSELWVADPDENKLKQLKQRFHVNTTTQNNEAIQSAYCVILAVKPQIIDQVTSQIASLIQETRPLIISVAAGISVQHLQLQLGSTQAIVRCMPNMPALIQQGATVLYANHHVSKDQHQTAEILLSAVGTTAWVNQESTLNAVTALSGSGPAYFFLIIEVLQQIGHEMGLTPDLARQLTVQTALGAAHMAAESPESIEQLRQSVTSKGGTTEAALRVLEESNIRSMFNKALHAAKQRAEELGRK